MFTSCHSRVDSNIIVHTLVIERNVRGMSKEEKNLGLIAKDILLYNDTIVKGGNKCTRTTTVCGKILKYIFAEREWTFDFVGQLLGMTAQSVNHIVNRQHENSFNPVYLRRLCKSLNIDYDYFCELRDLIVSMG